VIAKQIEPPNTGMEHIAVEYYDDGRLWALRKPLDYRDLVYMVRNDYLIVTNSEGAGFRGDSLSELGKFLDAIRHLREPEDETETCENCCEPTRKGKTCDTCRLIVTNARKVEETSKDLEKAIELLEAASRFIGYAGEVPALELEVQELQTDMDAFLSRVGGDNE